MKFVHAVEGNVGRRSKLREGEKARKGAFNIWDVAPGIADDLGYDIKELIPEGIKKIECRFYDATPELVAIIHSTKGRTFVIRENSEYLDEEAYEEMGFDPDKYPQISDSIMCVYSPYILAISDIRKEEFLKDHQVSKSELEEIRKQFNDYTADFVL
jgi:hypothetical protein